MQINPELQYYFQHKIDWYLERFKYTAFDDHPYTLSHLIESFSIKENSGIISNGISDPSDYKLFWLINHEGASGFLISLLVHLLRERGIIFEDKDEIYNAGFFNYAKSHCTDDFILDVFCDQQAGSLLDTFLHLGKPEEPEEFFFNMVFSSHKINYLFLDVLNKYSMDELKDRMMKTYHDRLSLFGEGPVNS